MLLGKDKDFGEEYTPMVANEAEDNIEVNFSPRYTYIRDNEVST